MIATKTVRILISCPGDVTPEKDEVIRICRDFSISKNKSKIDFTPLDWRDYVGRYGKNSQKQLNEYFGEYDIYIGILWKRFGTKTGNFNPDGNEFNSGTEEEYHEAIKIFDLKANQNIHFFFKRYDIDKDLLEKDQLEKVEKFRSNLIENKICFLNDFKLPEEFRSQIIKLLQEVQWNILTKENARIDTIRHKHSKWLITSNSKLEEVITSKYAILDRQVCPANSQQSKNISINDLIYNIEKHKRIILLGSAGSGKSVELYSIFKKFCHDESNRIPIYQELKKFTSEQTIENFLPKGWEDIPEEMLFIVWDGLDEILPDQRLQAIRQINNFSIGHPNIAIVISCRTNFLDPISETNSSVLSDFHTYVLIELSQKDVELYFKSRFSESNYDTFIKETNRLNLSNLLVNPFFLKTIVESYIIRGSFPEKRVELFENLFLDSIEFDKEHYKNTVDYRANKVGLVKILERIALCMKMMPTYMIAENELMQIIDCREFDLIKCCSIFQIIDNVDKWGFIYNNFQEYLAAKGLSGYCFGKILPIISYAPHYKKINPNWVNTLSFLFSILEVGDDDFDSLIQWIIENEHEVLVKFENEKIPEETRIIVFQKIFNYYKENDVWLRSKNFNAKELAAFGQSKKNIEFILKEINSSINSKTTLLNAVDLLTHFNITKSPLNLDLQNALIKKIEQNIENPDFVSRAIYALKEVCSEETIDELVFLIGEKAHPKIRSAIYSLLADSEKPEKHIRFLLHGIQLFTESASKHEHDFSECMHIDEFVKKIKSTEGIKSLIAIFISIQGVNLEFEYNDFYISTINNAITAFKNDSDISNYMIDWFEKESNNWNFKNARHILSFFERTNTRILAFETLVARKKEEQDKPKMSLALLIAPDLFQLISGLLQNAGLSIKEIKILYFNMQYVNSPHVSEFKKHITNHSGVDLEPIESVNYEEIKKQRIIDDFLILFDKNIFLGNVLRIFEEEEKNEFTLDELFTLKKSDFEFHTNNYSVNALNLIREIARKYNKVCVESVKKWFTQTEAEEWYRISKINATLNNKEELDYTLNSEQMSFITDWCSRKMKSIDFKKALTVKPDGSISFNKLAHTVFFLSKIINLNWGVDIMLDMLSFIFWQDDEDKSISYIELHAAKNAIIDRMIDNIRSGIPYYPILEKHIKYLTRHKVTESYQYILKEITNPKWEYSNKYKILEIFIDNTRDAKPLKSIVDKVDRDILWIIFDKLIAAGEQSYVESELLKILNEIDVDEVKVKASEMLIGLNNIEGLAVYVELYRKNIDSEISYQKATCIKKLHKSDAIPYLLDLLKLSYQKETRVDDFFLLSEQIREVIYNISLLPDLDKQQLLSDLNSILVEFKTINPNAKFLFYTIQSIEEQFLINQAKTLSIRLIKKKLTELEK